MFHFDRIDIDSNDRTLINAAQNGNDLAFKWLVQRYQARTFSIAYRLIGNAEDAKDVSQEAFVKLFQNISQFRSKGKFFTWLYRIIVNSSYDFLRKKNRFRVFPLEETAENHEKLIYNPDDKDYDQMEKIYVLMQFLSTNQKTTFLLREIEGLSCKEIAKILNCPEGTVRSYLCHARRILKELIEKHYPEFLKDINHEVCTR